MSVTVVGIDGWCMNTSQTGNRHGQFVLHQSVVSRSLSLFLLPSDFVVEANPKNRYVSTTRVSGWDWKPTDPPTDAGGTDKSFLSNADLAKHKIRRKQKQDIRDIKLRILNPEP
jgi:hypothetical protein